MDSVRINSSLETLCYEGNRKHTGDRGKLVVKGGGSFKEVKAKASLKVYTEILIWGDSAPRARGNGWRHCWLSHFRGGALGSSR